MDWRQEVISLAISFENSLKEDLKKVELKDSKLTVISVIESMNNTYKTWKMFLYERSNKNLISLSEKDVDVLLNKTYTKVSEEFLDFDEGTLKKSKFNTVFVGTIRGYIPNELDIFDLKDGNLIKINVVAGKAPHKLVVFEDEALEKGFYIGKSYLINCVELDEQPYGEREFEFTPIKELQAMEVISAVDKLGNTEIINVY